MDGKNEGSGTTRHGHSSSSSNGNVKTEEEKLQRKEESREAMRIIQEMSSILNTGLDAESLAICLRLCENGANPQTLASLIKGWRQEQCRDD